MKTITALTIAFLSSHALAHYTHAPAEQHGAEHLLLASLLIPLVWLIARKLSK